VALRARWNGACPRIIIAGIIEHARTAALDVMVCFSSYPNNFYQELTAALQMIVRFSSFLVPMCNCNRTFPVGCRQPLSAALYVMTYVCAVLRQYCRLVIVAVFVKQARTSALYVMVCLSSFPTNFQYAPTVARVVNRLCEAAGNSHRA